MSSRRSMLMSCGAVATALAATLLPALAASLAFFPLDARRIDLPLGRALFEGKCAACHTVSTQAPAGYGPSLFEIGKTAATRKPGLSAADYLWESIVEPAKFRTPGVQGEMPRGLVSQFSDVQLMSLIAYLESQQGTVAYRELLKLPRPQAEVAAESRQRLALESVERGRELYLGKLQCALCHPFDAHPGTNLIAPNLAKAGYQSRRYLQEAILHPSRHIVPGYLLCQVSSDGKIIQGRRLAQSNEEIRLLTVDLEGHRAVATLPLKSLDPWDDADEQSIVASSDISSMPDYSRTIAPDELEAVLDFLATLR